MDIGVCGTENVVPRRAFEKTKWRRRAMPGRQTDGHYKRHLYSNEETELCPLQGHRLQKEWRCSLQLLEQVRRKGICKQPGRQSFKSRLLKEMKKAVDLLAYPDCEVIHPIIVDYSLIKVNDG